MILAKTGYAVGAIRMRSGVRIDGLQLVFMKKQGDALNPDDCYVSEFVGASSGGQGIESTGKGSFIVGVEGQGRLEIRSLGLLVPK